jgi:2-polyprenyl-6-methoxyphenol hydroxylase-like FAD-dependent oxidoreductase
VLGKCLRDQPNPEHAFVAFEQLRRPRVERIIKAALRVNNSKAATGVARVIRDLTLPLILKLTANSGSAKEVFGYRVDWGSSASTVGDEGRQLVNV